MGSLYIDLHYKNTVHAVKKSEFKDLLSSAINESCFIFNSIFYKQIDRVAMGSPLGPSLTNAYHENIWLDGCHLTIIFLAVCWIYICTF